MNSGIYLIQYLLNGKCYIGQSINVDNRIKEHFRKLRKNKHNNFRLQNAFNKYGEKHFNSIICIKCPIDVMDYYEKFYIKLFDSTNFGYNIEHGGNLQKKISEESKVKMSIAKKGKHSKLKGRKYSNELKLKLSLVHIGKPSPKKGKKTNKPSWNSGKKGLQISKKRIKVEVFDSNGSLGVFDCLQHFRDKFNYKSKNCIKLNNGDIKLGKYIVKTKDN